MFIDYLKHIQKTSAKVPMEWFLLLLLFVTGCVAGDGGKKQARCGANEAFNSVTRACDFIDQGGDAEDEVDLTRRPRPLQMGTVFIPEDLLILVDPFETNENDKVYIQDVTTGDINLGVDPTQGTPTSCNAETSSAGIQTRRLIGGLLFLSKSSVTNGSQILIKVNSGAPSLSASLVAVPGSFFQTIQIDAPTGATATQVFQYFQASAPASVTSLVDVIAFDSGQAVLPTGFLALNEIPCACSSGACEVRITPALNYFGTTNFSYTLTNTAGTSDPLPVTLQVQASNDAPVLTLHTASISATELFNDDPSSATSYAQNLVSAGVISMSDVDSSGITLLMTQAPTQAFEYSLSSSGFFTYKTRTNGGTDSFKVVAVDNLGRRSQEVTIGISITAVNDPPVASLNTFIQFTEDSSQLVTLSYTDEEGVNPADITCEIPQLVNGFLENDCSCNAITGACSVTIHGLPNFSGVGSFTYIIHEAGSDKASVATSASFSVLGVADDPLIFLTASGATPQFLESATSVALGTYNFTIDSPIDLDGGTITSIEVTDGPSRGSLADCLGTGSNDLSCRYIPDDGNVADTVSLDNSIPSSDIAQTFLLTPPFGTIYSTTLGSVYVEEVQLKPVYNLSGYTGSNFHLAFMPDSVNSGADSIKDKVLVLYDNNPALGLTGSDLRTVILNDSSISKLIGMDVADPNLGTLLTTGTFSLTNSVQASSIADSFELTVTTSSGVSEAKRFPISITPVDDNPTFCQTSTFEDTHVCGLNGCIGDARPDSITPNKDGLIYYSRDASTCFQSSGSAWYPIANSVKNVSTTEGSTITIDNIVVDESGDVSEDAQSLTIASFTSSNTSLIPTGNISFFYGEPGSFAVVTAGVPFAGAASGDLKKFRIQITPQGLPPATNSSMSEIDIFLEDSGTPGNNSTQITFQVTVVKNSAVHGEWTKIIALGPKVDSFGNVEETNSRQVCPYSLDQCNDGLPCTGGDSPLLNASFEPDSVNAVYLQDTGSSVSCFRMKRTQVQNLSFVGKSSNDLTISYVGGGTAGSELVSVSGNDITVTIQDGVSDTDDIKLALENSGSPAKDLVKVINLKPGQTQTTQSAVTVGSLSSSSWESFSTFCSATPVDFEPGCAGDGRTTCSANDSPIDLGLTPTNADSRFWDEEADVCYRAIVKSAPAIQTWEAYDAPADISITWNPFTLDAAGTINEYRIFRRLAGESFDFTQPLNRETIAHTTSAITYVDNGVNSKIPPSPGTVYYYVVRPVVDGILSSTQEEATYGTLRVVAPPKNMAFAHRSMINKEVCTLIAGVDPDSIPSGLLDPDNNNRCSYQGPGDSTVASGFFDYGKDLLVDRFEAGCPYSPAPNCVGTGDNSCIGNGSPTSKGIIANPNLIYYDRSTTKCHISSGGSWREMGHGFLDDYIGNIEPHSAFGAFGSTLVSSNPQKDTHKDKLYNRPQLPPLVNLNQSEAAVFCAGMRDIPQEEFLGVDTDLAHKLPTRNDQMAFGMWDKSILSDTEVDALERGLSLNSTSKCNSSSAAGLEAAYNSLDKPTSNNFYSLPSISTSTVRTVATGSSVTENCKSIFGIQDLVGNVAEWTLNGFHCPLGSQCFTNDNMIVNGIEFRRRNTGTTDEDVYIFDISNTTSLGAASGGLTDPTAGAGTVSVSVVDNGTVASTLNEIVIQIDITEGSGLSSADVFTALQGNATLTNMFDMTLIDGTVTFTPPGNNVMMGVDPIKRALFMDQVDGSTVVSDLGITGFVADDGLKSADATVTFGHWSFDSERSICNDVSGDGFCDSFQTNPIELESQSDFLPTIGFPVNPNLAATAFSGNDPDLATLVVEVEPHDDSIKVNNREIASEFSSIPGINNSGCGGMATGGSYLDTQSAGYYAMKGVPCSDGISVVTIGNIAFKMLNSDHLGKDIEITNDASGTLVTNGTTVITIDASVVCDIGAGTDERCRAGNFVEDIRSALAAINIEPFLVGSPDPVIQIGGPTEIPDLRETAKSKGPEVGFRCIIELDSQYEE